MNLSAVDLNLFLVLQTALRERSATRAAAKLHVTQSAVSNALVRLRRMFGDPLLVRAGRGLVPTPRALAMVPELDAAIERLRGLLARGDVLARRFTIACADVVTAVILPGLTERLPPGASIRVMTLDQMMHGGGLSSGEVDLLIGLPPALPPGCSAELAYEDELVVVARKGHPAMRRGRITLEAYLAASHVDVAMFGPSDVRVDGALGGRSRDVRVTVPHFSVVPAVVARTDAIATLPRRLVEVLAPGLQRAKPPVKLGRVAVKQVWHERSAEDEGTKRLRRWVREAANDRASSLVHRT